MLVFQKNLKGSYYYYSIYYIKKVNSSEKLREGVLEVFGKFRAKGFTVVKNM